MAPREKGSDPIRVRRVRKRRRPTDDDPKAHYGWVPAGQHTKRILQQIANGDSVSWEGEYRDD